MDETAPAATVADLMQREVLTVSPSTPIGEVVRIFREGGISGTPVVDETGKTVGIVSETDLAWLMDRFAAEAREAGGAVASLRDVTAGDVMTADVFGVPPDASITELAAFFARTGLGRAAVLEDGELRGIVSVIDLLEVFGGESRPRRTARRG